LSRRTADPAELKSSGEFVQAGRIHESRHEIQEAIDSYISGEAWQEAARLLSFQGRFRDAGMTLLRSLPSRPTPVLRISPDVRRDAMNAALCFARGGARKEAVGLLMNLGEHQRAAGLLQMAGLREEAVRAMRGEPLEGSPWPPGILFNPAAQGQDDVDSGPSWGSRPSTPGSTPSQRDSAPWESGRSSPPSRPPGPPRPPGVSGSTPATSSLPPLQSEPSTDGYLSSSLEFTPLGMESEPSPVGANPTPTPRTNPLSHTPNPLSRTPGPGTVETGLLRRGTPGSLVQQELASYLATNPDDRSYPIAVNRIIELVWNSELLSARVTRFLDEYLARVGGGAVDPSGYATLYALGRLFEFHDRIDGAKTAYRALLGSSPEYADAQLRLSNIEAGLAEAIGGTWQPVHLLIDGVHKFSPLPEFDDMPQLGTAPGAAVGTPPSGSLDRDAPPARARSASNDETVDFTDFAGSPSGRHAASGDDTMDVQDYVTSGSVRAQEVGTSSGGRDSSRQSYDGAYAAETDAEGAIIEGTVIANRYRIEGLVGSGGMAHVYRATDLELEEVVAIKVFQQVVQNRAGLDRFRREMKLSRKLVHPNIVRIYEFGTWRGARFITMELLRGDDLENHLVKQPEGRMETAEALRLMIQACDGLGAAHEAGVIHRDVKPQNLFVIEKGTRLKIMDFGIAKVNNSAASISVTGVRVGTPRYMSPEQIQGDAEVTPASDLYALGGVMYELFTGSPVFQEEDLVPLLLSHMTEAPQPPRDRFPGVPADVEQIILRLLSKSPDDRYESCADLKKALLQAFVKSQR